MAREARKIVVISDLHCGSRLALMPPIYTDTEGNTYTRNAAQVIVGQVWDRFLEWLWVTVGDSPYAVVWNGDLVEGVHHGGKQTVTLDMADHVSMALEVMKPVNEHPQCTKRFVTIGTEGHSANTEYGIGYGIDAEKTEDGRWAHPELNLRVNDYPMAFWHHMPTSTRFHLSASQLSIQWTNAVINRVAWGFEPPKLICAGHRHVAGSWTFGNGGFVVTAAWQARTRYGMKVVPGVVEAFGAAVLDFTGTLPGTTPQIRMFVEPLPPPKFIDA